MIIKLKLIQIYYLIKIKTIKKIDLNNGKVMQWELVLIKINIEKHFYIKWKKENNKIKHKVGFINHLNKKRNKLK